MHELLTTYYGDIQHPLYSVLGHASIAVLGETAAPLRLPAIAFGVASIPLLFLVGRVVATTREALLSAALLTFSYHHVWFSQNAAAIRHCCSGPSFARISSIAASNPGAGRRFWPTHFRRPLALTPI